MLDPRDEAEFAQVAGVVEDRAAAEAELADRGVEVESDVAVPAAVHARGKRAGKADRRLPGFGMVAHHVPGCGEEVTGAAELP
ncbi:hypothetical protein ACGFWD_42580 [Streptomyces sp. NPDC048448]|uniref:hypothetical protein n=1 Tax=Streptomyces sp. NPDC048448 TaxID=3365554 RepID=UPI003721C5DF